MSSQSKTAFITGSTRGIGFELTKQLLQRKYHVIASGRKAKNNSDLAVLKSKNPEAVTILNLDVTSDADLENLKRELKNISRIDLLINNAGIFKTGDDQKLEDIDPECVVSTFVVNSLGPLKVTQTLMPWLKNSSKPTIVNITSQMGSIDDNTMGRYYGYRMSKAALNIFNKSLSIDYPDITSIVMHPGWVKTEMGGSQAPTLPEESAKGIISVIENLKPKDSGKFLNFEGQELKW